MPRRHRGERRRRILLAAVVVIGAAACSGSSPDSSSSDPTIPPVTFTPLPTSAPDNTATIPPTTSTTLPLTISTMPVSGPTGVVAVVTSVNGRGPATIALPASVGRPAMVHAQYGGTGRFVVNALDAQKQHLAVLAASVGAYTGTFPVGFVDPANRPTAFVRVITTGPWHLDIANPVLAPVLSGSGVSGHGDALLLYKGPSVAAHVTYPGITDFIVHAFDNGAESVLVSELGPVDRQITLPAGPAFISVTAAGDWSMSIG
jgi:hypothetical protein